MNPIWPRPWRSLLTEDEAPFLETQLQRELVDGHPLFGQTAKALARRDDVNDALFGLSGGRVTIVHLTFSKGPFTRLIPWAEVYADIEALIDELRNRYCNPKAAAPRIDLLHPVNQQPLKVLACDALPLFTLPTELPHDGDQDLGTHPDLWDRVWHELGGRLPTDERCLVYNRPALVSPAGVLLAVARGTHYALHVPEQVTEWAIESVVRVRGEQAREEQADLRSKFGDGWLIGTYLDHEIGWCRQMHALYA